MNISYERIKNANSIISPVLKEFPIIYSYELSKRFSSNIFIKPENLQITGSFKIRGAYYKVFQMKEINNGVITGPFYNFGYALSYVGSKFNTPVYVVFPENCEYDFKPLEEYGANILIHGNSYEDVFQKIERLKKEKGLIYIDPKKDLDIISAYGTIALEILRDEKSLEIIVVPVKHGALISGISIFIKEILPQVRVVGVYKKDNLFLNNITSKIVEKYVDDLISVEEDTINEAIKLYVKDLKMVAEEGAAYPLAALLEEKIKIKNKSVGLILSGGNISFKRLKEVL